ASGAARGGRALCSPATHPVAPPARHLREGRYGRKQALRGGEESLCDRQDRDQRSVHRAKRKESGAHVVHSGIARILDRLLSAASGHALRLRSKERTAIERAEKSSLLCSTRPFPILYLRHVI